MSVTQSEFRNALGCFATGVTVITLDYENEVHGMTANAFTSVSLDPPLVLVCVDQRARTHAHLHAKKRFGVNVLSEDQRAISEYYARVSRIHQHAEKEAGARFDRTAARNSGAAWRAGLSRVPLEYRRGCRRSHHIYRSG